MVVAKSSSFNPTLVRLRQAFDVLPSILLPGFNPTLVRLRPRHPIAHRFPVKSFNPTLVRLRPLSVRAAL